MAHVLSMNVFSALLATCYDSSCSLVNIILFCNSPFISGIMANDRNTLSYIVFRMAQSEPSSGVKGKAIYNKNLSN